MYKISELHHSDVAKESVKISKANQKLYIEEGRTTQWPQKKFNNKTN
jgi:hypothetical protein